MRATGAIWRAATRRGMTMIEVLLASVLLAMLASALMGTVVYANRSEQLRIKRLMAYDVANRILLQYVDERHSKDLPPQTMVIMHEGQQFRYELFEETTSMEMIEAERPGIAEDLKLIRVRVYDTVEPVPGDVQRGEKLAELVRPHHLLMALFRGEDSKGRNVQDSQFLNEIKDIQGFGSGTGRQRGNRGGAGGASGGRRESK